MRHFPELRSEPDQASPREIVRSGLCIGCGSCAAAEPRAEMRWDRDGFLKPHGPPDWYRARSRTFARQCPFSPAAPDEDQISSERFAEAHHSQDAMGRFEAAYVGHVAEGEWRATGSSGGLTSWIAGELLRTGAVDAVAHVRAADPGTEHRLFTYIISRSHDEVGRGAKSRYYPVELSHVIGEIRRTPGRYAIVGIPCFIKAVHLLRRLDPLIRERVTHTIGLFCGHMKSAHMVESFAWQLGAEIEQVQAIDYRRKDASRPANWYRASLQLSDGAIAEQDWWHLADGDWGAGFLQNPACDFCDDVMAETADIALGDAWLEPYSSDGRGTNVVVVRSPELDRLVKQAIADGRLELEPVDAQFVEATQEAGLRHRRQGLAYRLTWRRRGVRPSKRVAPSSAGLPVRRKLIYRMRALIAASSHRMFRLARRLRAPWLYTGWARLSLRLYQSLAWSRGRLGRLFDAAMGVAKG